MIAVRQSADRGHFNHGWLNTHHTFSFGDYFEPQQMGFRSLRVINEDRIAPGQGFGLHGHRDMEIVTYVLSGALAHQDSLGNGGVLRAGELQHMTAGSGIRHSEFNASNSEPVHLYQIWLLPRQGRLTPSYSQKTFDAAGRRHQWQLVASPDGSDGSLTIQQDARILLAALEANRSLARDLRTDHHAWLQVLRGSIDLAGIRLETGDGAAVSGENRLVLAPQDSAEVMLFELS